MRKSNEEQTAGRCGAEKSKNKEHRAQKSIGPPQFARDIPLHGLALRLFEKARIYPVFQKLLNAKRFFICGSIGSHDSLPKRRAMTVSVTSMAIPVTTK